MQIQRFFKVFATRVEKVAKQPVQTDGDFDWRRYFDPDMPVESQMRDALRGADEYLSEYGYQCDPQSWADAAQMLSELVS